MPMNSRVINEQNIYIVPSGTVNLLSTNAVRGVATNEGDRKGFLGFPELPAAAWSLALPTAVLPKNIMF